MTEAVISSGRQAPASPFGIRAVVEGFYGVFYTFPERKDMLEFTARHGFTHYIYCPKNDRQHRNRWFEPYPARIMSQFGECVAVAQQAGISFCYAIAPGVSIVYSSAEDFACLTAKLSSFYQCGVRNFCLMLDDLADGFRHDEDRKRYHSTAEAHADLANRVNDWLHTLNTRCTLWLVPAEYYGAPPFTAYLQELGLLLQPDIQIFYSGKDICSRTIDTTEVDQFAAAARRKPLIWDNYPVNDLHMQPELHIGPLQGRAGDLAAHVQGYAANLMIQAEASKVPLITCADYLADPSRYDAQAAWEAAIEAVAGAASAPYLHRLAENSLHSCLGTTEAEKLQGLVDQALQALFNGQPVSSSLAVQELDDYLTDLDEACYHLLNRMEHLALRANLVPWIEQLDNWTQLGRNSLRVLRALELGEPFESPLYFFNDYYQAAMKHPKRIAGEIMLSLAQTVIHQIEARKVLADENPPVVSFDG